VTDKIVVLSTASSEQEARQIARRLVEERLAACVNIVPRATSIYHWQGVVEEAAEWILVIKSSRSLFESLRGELERMHSYQVPEIVALPVVDGSDAYLKWLDRELAGDPGPAVA